MKHLKSVSKPNPALILRGGPIGKILDLIADLKGPVVS